MNPTTLSETLRGARGRGKKAVARLARRVLPPTTVTLNHVEPGLRLTVNLRRHVMFWSGGLRRFEPYTVRALRAAVRPGDTVFDAGANIGFFSTLLSRWVGPSGRVLAFEPEPENLALLRRNVAANGCENVEVVPCALGAEPGTATFSVDESTGSTGHLGDDPTAGEVAVGTGKVRLIEMAVGTIDAMVACDGLAPEVIKMDIEGGEIDALQGASRTLAEHGPIVFSELSGDAGARVITFFRARRYLLWDLEGGREVGPGDVPFMVVALPDRSVEGERGLAVREALADASSWARTSA
jgi:FkbM family methyltransferase